jgi:hypothetical protein
MLGMPLSIMVILAMVVEETSIAALVFSNMELA